MAHSPFGSFLISSCLIAQSAAASLAVVSTEEPSALTTGAAAGACAGAGAGAVCGAAADLVSGAGELDLPQPMNRNSESATKAISAELPKFKLEDFDCLVNCIGTPLTVSLQ